MIKLLYSKLMDKISTRFVLIILSIASLYIMLFGYKWNNDHYSHYSLIHNTEINYAIILLLLIVLFLFFGFISVKQINKTAYKLYLWSLFCLIVNVLVFTVLYLQLWSLKYVVVHQDWFYNIYFFSQILASSYVSSLFLIPIIYNYTNNYTIQTYRWDFLIPIWSKKYFDKRLKNEQERKSLVVIVLYPFYIVGVTPLGIFIWLYIIPMAFILFIILELRALLKWIFSSKQEAADNIIDNKYLQFKDYYILLGLSQTATTDEVNTAFKLQLSLFQSNPQLYNKQYCRDLIESYKVLSSEQRLRPMYDREYQKYLQQQNSTYTISDNNLIRDIKVIREQISNQIKSKVPPLLYINYLNINALFLSFIITMITLVCLLPLFFSLF